MYKPQRTFRLLLTRLTVAVATLLLLGTVFVGIVPAELPSIIPPPTAVPTATPVPAPDLSIGGDDVALGQPLAEGEPFTATVTIHNLGDLAAERVQVVFAVLQLNAAGEQNIVTQLGVAGPIAPHAALQIPISIPPVVPLKPGTYQYRVAVNIQRGLADRNLRNNALPLGVFALAPPLARCTDPPDLALEQRDILDQGDVVVITLRNLGPATLYNVVVRVRSLDANALPPRTYQLARLLPCGGTATITPFRVPGTLEAEVNPIDLPNVVPEASHDNNVARQHIKP